MAGDLIDRVREGFRTTFGREAEGVWSAPGRVSVGGDHTDLQDGLSLAFAVDERTAVAVARRDDGAITVATDLTDERASASLATLRPGDDMAGWRAYPLGMVWAVVEHGRAASSAAAGASDADAGAPADTAVVGTGLDVFLSTDLPIGGGLASSASICAAVGLALRDLWRLDLSNATLARLGNETEVHAAGAATGIADHVTVLEARAGNDVFYDVRGRDASSIGRTSPDDDGLVSVLVETGETHRNWSSEFRDRQEACTRVAAALDRQTLREVRPDELEAAAGRLDPVDLARAHHVLTEIQRTLELTRLLRTEGAAPIGPLLRASQASLRDDFGVSTERIDVTCELAEHLGALGARMSGTGLGGSVYALLPAECEAEYLASVVELYRERGWGDPRPRRVAATDGARRDA